MSRVFLSGAAWRGASLADMVGTVVLYANRGPIWSAGSVIGAGDSRVEGNAALLPVKSMPQAEAAN